MSNPYPALGLAFVLAGVSKLAGSRSYRKLVSDLGWTDEQMRQVGLAEVAGGPRCTRRVGGVVLAATSAAVLARELQRDDNGLALPRAGLLLGALGAAVKP